jgi:hypothetical protein
LNRLFDEQEVEQEFTFCALLPFRSRPKRSLNVRRPFRNQWADSTFAKGEKNESQT